MKLSSTEGIYIFYYFFISEYCILLRLSILTIYGAVNRI
jgi:hypothetical protein